MNFHYERVVDADPEAAWRVVSDVEAYAEAAPSLSGTEVLAGSGEGLVRRCTTRAGSWEEVCTLWEPGRAYEMTVRAETYPQPLRAMLAGMRGRWQIEPGGAGTRIAMTFEATPRFGALGSLMLRLTRRRFDRECQAILDHLERVLRSDRLDTRRLMAAD
jgi:ribosome-associated toxin RatA of RatAB toxin-antitoxin module